MRSDDEHWHGYDSRSVRKWDHERDLAADGDVSDHKSVNYSEQRILKHVNYIAEQLDD